MTRRAPAVEAFIARAPAFAWPLLARIREAFHAGSPPLEERIEWGASSFEHHGPLGGMAAFKGHVSFGFWKARPMEDPARAFAQGPRARRLATAVAWLSEGKRRNWEYGQGRG